VALTHDEVKPMAHEGQQHLQLHSQGPGLGGVPHTRWPAGHCCQVQTGKRAGTSGVTDPTQVECEVEYKDVNSTCGKCGCQQQWRYVSYLGRALT
jgi:hypothetical protein